MADVVLVGLPGSGKTTIGRALASTMGVDFIDTDDAFFERENVSVQDYLRAHGDAAFREREVQALAQALSGASIVATGGGVVTTLEARQLLRHELTVWLDCPDEILVTRVRDGDRPLLDDDPAARLLELRQQRDSLYADVSRFKVDSSGPLDELVLQLLNIVESA